MSALDAYREKYQGKPTAIKIIVPVATELFPEYVKPKPTPQPEPLPQVAAPDPLEKPSHIALLHQVMQEEDQVRQYRESLRIKYYDLEDKKAPRIEFQRNHAAITEQTKKLQELYIRRKHIEIHGKAPEKRSILTEDENNALRRLKYDRDRLIDKSGKLKKKIQNYLSAANGITNRPRWESELEEIELKILEIDQQIDKIHGI